MLAELKLELQKVVAKGDIKEFHAVSARENGHVVIKGKKLLDFTDWDLLGLSEHKKVKACTHEEVESVGISSASSRLVSGTHSSHIRAEKRLEKFLSAESALLFSSKNQAVLSLVTALFCESDFVVVDDMLQSPVVDACYLVGAECASFQSSNVSSLEKQLEKAGALRRKFIFVEAVSPLSGLRADIPALSAVALRHRASLIVDESYALGMLGPRGAGGLELCWGQLGVEVFCEYADLGLGLGCYGAAICGPEVLLKLLAMRSRTFWAETAMPPAMARALEASIDLCELMPIARQRVLSLATRLRLGLAKLGKASNDDPETSIVCIPFGRLSLAQDVQNGLFARGFLAEALSLRRALSDEAIVRVLISSSHTEKHIDSLLEALVDVLAIAEPKV